MTSDGIHQNDWGKLEALAAELVAATGAGDSNQAELIKQRLLEYLSDLEKRYGTLPSILATRADYLDDNRERIENLSMAFELATRSNDFANCTFIASSLANLHIEETRDFREGERWLGALGDSLARHWDDDEHREYVRLSELMLDGRK